MSAANAASAADAKELDNEASSFEDFYRREYRSMVGLAFVLTGNRWSAEDTAQDAMAAAFTKWSTVSKLEKPSGWVRRVTCNRSVSVVRRRIRDAKLLVKLGSQPQHEFRLDKDADEFWRAVRTLPARQAQVIALFYFDDLSVSDIADILKINEGSVKTHLSRGRLNVAQQLQLEVDDE